MSLYATNQEVVEFFASHGIAVTEVHRLGMSRHLKVEGQPVTLPMPASPDECLRIVRECIARIGAKR
jgi:maleate cis-trans isomerase